MKCRIEITGLQIPCATYNKKMKSFSFTRFLLLLLLLLLLFFFFVLSKLKPYVINIHEEKNKIKKSNNKTSLKASLISIGIGQMSLCARLNLTKTREKEIDKKKQSVYCHSLVYFNGLDFRKKTKYHDI